MKAEKVALGDVELSCYVAGSGPVVILAHGFPDEPMTFSAQIDALVAAGYRTVAPVMRGYAPSSEARSGKYDAASIGDDLIALSDHFSPDAKVHLVGHDWGAIATFAAATKAPERLASIVTISVPHLRALLPHYERVEQLERSWYIGLFQLPIVAENELAKNDMALIDKLFRDWSPGYSASPEELDVIKSAIRPRIKPVLAYYRSLIRPKTLFGDSRGRLFARVTVPATHLHGADDGCVGIECCEGAERFHLAGYRFVRIEGAGHFVTREKPIETSTYILDAIRNPPQRGA